MRNKNKNKIKFKHYQFIVSGQFILNQDDLKCEEKNYLLRGGGCGANQFIKPLSSIKTEIRNSLTNCKNLDIQTLRQLFCKIIQQKEQIQVQAFTIQELEDLISLVQTKIQSINTLDKLCSIYFLEILNLFTTLFFQKLLKEERLNQFRYLRDDVNLKLNQNLQGLAYQKQINSFEFILTYLHSKEELNLLLQKLPPDFIGYYLPWHKQIEIKEQLKELQEIIIETENQLIKYEELQENTFNQILIFKLNHCFDKIERLIQLSFRKEREKIETSLNSLYTQVIQNSTHWYIRNLWVRLLADLLIIRPQFQINQIDTKTYNDLQSQNIIKTLDEQFFFILYQNGVNRLTEVPMMKQSLQVAVQMVNDIISLRFPIFDTLRATLNFDEKIQRINNQSQRSGIEIIEPSLEILTNLNSQQFQNLEKMQQAAEEMITCAFRLVNEFQNLCLRFIFSKHQEIDFRSQYNIIETQLVELSQQKQVPNSNSISLLKQFNTMKIFLIKQISDKKDQMFQRSDLQQLDLKIRCKQYLNLTIIQLFQRFCQLCVNHQNKSPQNSFLIISTGSILMKLSQICSLLIENKIKFLMDFKQNLTKEANLLEEQGKYYNLLKEMYHDRNENFNLNGSIQEIRMINNQDIFHTLNVKFQVLLDNFEKGQDQILENNILKIINQYDDATQQLQKLANKLQSINKQLKDNRILTQYQHTVEIQQIKAAQIEIISQKDVTELQQLSQYLESQFDNYNWQGMSQENKLNFIYQIFQQSLHPLYQNQKLQDENLRECEIFQFIRIINFCQEKIIIDFALSQVLDYLNENQNNQMEDLIIQSLTCQNRQYTVGDLNAILQSKMRQLEINSQPIIDDNRKQNISSFNNQSLKLSFLSFWKKLYDIRQDVLKNDQEANSGFLLPLKGLNPYSIKEITLFSDSSNDGFQLFFDAQNEKVLVILGQLDNSSLVKKAEILIWKKHKLRANSKVPIQLKIKNSQQDFIQQNLKEKYKFDDQEINDLKIDVNVGKVLIIFLLQLEANWNIESLKQIVAICDQNLVNYKLLVFSKIDYFEELELDYLHSLYQVIEIQDFNNQMQQTITKHQNIQNEILQLLQTLDQIFSQEQALQNGAALQLTKKWEDELNQSFFNKQNITQYQDFFIQKNLSTLQEEWLIKIIKLSAQREELIVASSNAFYLYFKMKRVFNNQDFTKIKIKDIDINGCSFFKVNLSKSVFENVEITRCSFTNCNLNEVQWKGMKVKEFSVLDALDIISQLLILSSNSRSILCLDETNKQIIKQSINNSNLIKQKQDKLTYCFAVSQKGDLLALGHYEEISIWNTNDVTNSQTIGLKDENQIRCLYFQSDLNLIYCNSNKQVILYNIQNHAKIRILFQEIMVHCMTFSYQKQDLALGYDKYIQLYNLRINQDNQPLNNHQDILELLQFEMNTNYLISCSKDGQIAVWDPEKRILLKMFRIPEMMPLLITPDGKYVVSKNRQQYLCILDVQLQRQIFKLPDQLFKDKVICLSKDGRKLAFQNDKKSIQIWNMARFKVQYNIRDKIKCLEISPKDPQFAIGKFQQILICDIQVGMEIGKLEGHFGFINLIAYSSNAMSLVSAGDDRQIIYWDLDQQKKIKNHYHQSQILCVAISQNIEQIAFGDDKGMVQILSVKDFTVKYSKKVSQEQIKNLAFSNDQTQFYYVEGKKITLCAFNQQLNQEEKIVDSDTYGITCCVISQDGKYLARGSMDNSIKISQLNEKKEQMTFYGHKNTVTDLKFTIDYQQLWSCSLDSTIRLWDLKQKSTILQLDGGISKFQQIKLILNDQYLISLDQEQSIRKWDIYRELSIDNYQDEITEITIFSLSSDGVLLAYCGIESNFIVLDTQNKNKKCSKQCQRQLAYLQFVPHSLKLITQYFGQQGVTIWDFSNDNYLKDNYQKISIKISTKILAISTEGQYLAYNQFNNNENKNRSTQDPKIMLYQIEQQQEIELKGSAKSINILAQNYQNNIFIGFSKGENTIFFWDLSGNLVGKQVIDNNEKISAYSLDGEYFVYVIKNKTIKYYKISNLQSKNDQSQVKSVKLELSIAEISSIIISKTNLIIGLNNNDLKIYDMSKQEISKEFTIKSNPKLMTLSSNGLNLAIYTKDNQLEFIKLQIQLKNTVSYQSSSNKSINCVAYSKDGLRKAFGGIDQICIFFEEQQVPKFTIPAQTVKSIQFYQNGQKLISIQLNKVIIFDVNNGKELKKLEGMNQIISMSTSYDEATLAFAYEQAEIQIWNLQENLEELLTLKTTFKVKSTGLIKQFNKTSNLLVVEKYNLIIYKEGNYDKKIEYLTSNQSSINNIAISFDDDLIAASFENNSIILFKQYKQYDQIKSQSLISCIAFSSDAKILAFGRNDNFITFYQVESKQTFDFDCHRGKVTSIQFHPKNAEQFLSGGQDSELKEWIFENTSHIEYNMKKKKLISISSNQQKFAFEDFHNRIQICDIKTKAQKHFQIQSQKILHLKFSRDGQRLAIIYDNYSIQILQVDNHEQILNQDIFNSNSRIDSNSLIDFDFSNNNVLLNCCEYVNILQLNPKQLQQCNHFYKNNFGIALQVSISKQEDRFVVLTSSQKIVIYSNPDLLPITVIDTINSPIIEIKFSNQQGQNNYILVKYKTGKIEIFEFLPKSCQLQRVAKENFDYLFMIQEERNETKYLIQDFLISNIELNPKLQMLNLPSIKGLSIKNLETLNFQ